MCSRPTLSIHPTLFFPLSLFCVCLSTAARQVVHQYHLSRSHIHAVRCCAVLSHSVMSDSLQPHGLWPIYVLIYDICFSLSDALHFA